MVFGVSCPQLKADLGEGSVTARAENGVAVFASDGGSNSLGATAPQPAVVDHQDLDSLRSFRPAGSYGLALAASNPSVGEGSDPADGTNYTTKNILLKREAKITTPTDGVVNRYNFQLYEEQFVPGESVYDPASPDTPATAVVISGTTPSGGGTGGGGGTVPVPAPVPSHDETCPCKAFSDLDPARWYHEAVDYVLEKGLMNGVSQDRFSPDGETGRGMIVAILYRLEGQPAVSADNPFDDVEAGKWYTDPVLWASEKGIVNGYGDGRFGWRDPITRQQFAAILYRYAQVKGYDVSVGEDTNVLSYNDASDIKAWAMPAVQWACGAGLLQGDGQGNLLPGSSATRAQAAALIMRFAESGT